MKLFGRQFENRQREAEADAESAFADTMIDALGIDEEPSDVLTRRVADNSPANPYLELARAKKVAALVAVLRLGKITAEEAGRMTSAQWAEVARAAKVNMPSAETRARVIAELRESEET